VIVDETLVTGDVTEPGKYMATPTQMENLPVVLPTGMFYCCGSLSLF